MLSGSKNRAVTVVIGTVLVAIIGGLIGNYFNYQYRIVVAGERERLAVTANYLDMYFNTRLAGLKMLAACPGVKSLKPELAQIDLLAATDVLGLANVGLYDRNSRLITDLWTMPGYGRSPFEQWNYNKNFEVALSGQIAVSDRIVYGSIENAYINILVPITDGSDKVNGVLSAHVPISDISLSVLRESMPENQYIFVIDSSAQVVHHPRLIELYPECSLYKDQFSGMLNNKSGMKEFNSFLDGMDKLFIYTDLYNANWRVIMAMPLNAVYARVLSKSLEDAASFFFLAICFGLLYGVWRQAKRHEREREQLRMERMVCVNQLAAGIAHEIRNPLTAIKGFIQLMARRNDRPPRPEHLEIIVAEIGRIDSLISEFQMLARPPKEPVFEKVNICKLLQDVTFLMEGQLHTKNAAVTVKMPALGCTAVGDISQLKQVFINLLKNAVEAVPNEGRVVVAVGRQQGMMAITIEDNGNGIPAEIIDKLGTPFFTTKEYGTGLGLSVCYSIVQNHGGKITVASQVGQGTTFTVLLPAAGDESVPLTVDEQCSFGI
ncbi:sensor histidine kinase [Sporomusa sp.]|uniref:sensor histidine kinase n=1 Tax=Sporomusa sp. TaxID=2078658 RepID=UPI002CD5ED6F|nr:ATP-binding protein [Sporomusa sp.]HWR45761.1 ATP-binding protein [Sporomusa sp.]